MAFDQHFLKKGKSIPTAGDDSEKTSAGFDCNICLDYARDPVVTLCGHLYCWPCIYKWLNFQRASLASDLLPQCPVCKAEVSEKTLIPLYGGGKSLSEIEQGDKIIPPRPPARGIQGLMYMSNLNQQLTPPNPYQNPNDLPNHYASYEEDSSSVLFNSAATGVSPMIGKFGEMVYARKRQELNRWRRSDVVSITLIQVLSSPRCRYVRKLKQPRRKGGHTYSHIPGVHFATIQMISCMGGRISHASESVDLSVFDRLDEEVNSHQQRGSMQIALNVEKLSVETPLPKSQHSIPQRFKVMSAIPSPPNRYLNPDETKSSQTNQGQTKQQQQGTETDKPMRKAKATRNKEGPGFLCRESF
ncbi:E3 ubiquitin-protein ligase [Forsythia ovata]|uniref:E3 ubiquitin-protein ligase RMA n=1 Tax=Forsythia ovata TaxID=205694 RepID=A0ABD1QCM3_9LAMI